MGADIIRSHKTLKNNPSQPYLRILKLKSEGQTGDRPACPFSHSDISTIKPQAKQATAKYQYHLTVKKLTKLAG
ncbi:MAG: hypothetical protein FWG68_09265, partial [Defluviitaleaceae bacterium]|nr:hypothetical protein [Defluviitaleaceae bacterium]